MNRISFADALETASEQIGAPLTDATAALLRNAAIRIRNGNLVALSPHVDYSLAELAMEFGIPKDELIRTILKDWVEANYPMAGIERDEKSGVALRPLSKLKH